VGPVSRLDAALRLAHEEPLDAAILDVGIRGGKVYPVAEELLARNIGTVIGLSPRALTKPFRQHDLEQQVKLLLAKAGASIT
jgi:DNA-binding response OmpR family regulator